jgi:hypothetical protein
MAYAKALGVRFRDSWLVKDFEKVINPYLRPCDSVLFIPAGKYRYPPNLLDIDAYYLDIDEKVLSDVDETHKFVIDMFKADKVLNRKFDVVVSDPPYNIPYHKRPRFLKALSNLAKRTIVVKWNIIPRFPKFELKEVYIYEGRRWWTYASIITVFEKRSAMGDEGQEGRVGFL